MQALQITGYGEIKNNVTFAEVERPIIKDHQVLIEIHSAAINPIDYKIIEGHLKADPSVKFKYGNAVFPLCTEGKYIIGFVKVQQAGTWVLQAHIDNFGVQDQITHEIEISKSSSPF